MNVLIQFWLHQEGNGSTMSTPVTGVSPDFGGEDEDTTVNGYSANASVPCNNRRVNATLSVTNAANCSAIASVSSGLSS